MAVTVDVIDGNSAVLSLSGWTVNRIAIVSGLTGNGHAMIYEAYQALVNLNTTADPEGIDIGITHPTFTNAYCVQISPESIPQSGNAIRMNIEYRQYDMTTQYSISTNVEMEETNLNINDGGICDYMTVDYTYPADYPYNESLKGVMKSQWGLASRNPSFTVTRTERYSMACDAVGAGIPLTGGILLDRIQKYARTVNYPNWNVRPLAPDSSWICSDITCDSPDGGYSWVVKYTFKANPLTWNAVTEWIDPATGMVPIDVVQDTGRKTEQIYMHRNFSDLEIV